MSKHQDYNFEISLSVLNHLGRNLYRNFVTVLGEAISNAWDADAENVWIYIDRENDRFSIVDDGVGMDGEDFQNKFLRIGYSKRANGDTESDRERPFIGSKGIGKLALLSCAERISVFSKKEGGEFDGGIIDNTGLDAAINNDVTPDNYKLEPLNFDLLNNLASDLRSGTAIVFEGASEQLRNSIDQIRKLLALSFRFALIDDSFSIYVNDEEVALSDLQDLLDATQFCWIINGHEDQFLTSLENLERPLEHLETTLGVRGFIASVRRPRDLKIRGVDQRASIDLFVNGRLRESNLLRHIPSQRIVESYIYGQIHFDSMDGGGVDPFTTSREGVLEDNPDFASLLDYLKRDALVKIFDQWDKFRIDKGNSGDEDNPRKTKKQRKARDLYSASREEYKSERTSEDTDRVGRWLDEFANDAEFNFVAYSDCFIAENLLRRYVEHQRIDLSDKVSNKAAQWREQEQDKKDKANISIDIRETEDDIAYLGMDDLAYTAEGRKSSEQERSLWRDSVAYAPVRNVVGHTGRLTEDGKQHLKHVFTNIKARVRHLLSLGGDES